MRKLLLTILAATVMSVLGRASVEAGWKHRRHYQPYWIEQTCRADGTRCRMHLRTRPRDSLAADWRSSYWYAQPHRPHHHYDHRRCHHHLRD